MVSIPEVSNKRVMPIFGIGCISIFICLYFLNRDIARVGVYLLAVVGLFQIYKNGFKICKDGFLLKAVALFAVLMLVALYLGGVCCSGTDYYSKPFVHFLVMYPFILLNIFLSGWVRWLLNASLFFVTAGVFAYVFSDYPLHSAKYFESHYAVYLLVAPVAYAIFKSKLQFRTVLIIFAISGVIIGLAAIADLTGFARGKFWPFDEYSTQPNLVTVGVGLSMNSIHFGIVTAAVLAVVVAGLSMTASRLSRVEIVLAIISMLFLGFALITSGARSAWISLPFVFFIPFIFSPLAVRVKILVFMLFVLSLLLVVQLPYVQNRLRLVPEEISEYTGSTNLADSVRSTTSIGLRLELWRAAWEIFLNNPILGVGPGNFRNYTQDVSLGSTGRYHESIELHRNPHSLYFKALAERGVLGIISTLFILALPGALFLSHTRESRSVDVQVVAISGLSIVIVFSLGGLTIGSLHKTELHTFYIFFIALFSGLLLSSADCSKAS